MQKKKQNKTKRFLKSRQVYQKILKISNNSIFFFRYFEFDESIVRRSRPENNSSLNRDG